MIFSVELSFTMQEATKRAIKLKHKYFCLEHLLEALSSDWYVSEFLSRNGFDFKILENDLEDYYKQIELNETNQEIEQTPAVFRVITRASLNCQASGKSEITGLDVLECIIDEEDSFASYFLLKQGITKNNFISKNEEDKSGIDNNLLANLSELAKGGKLDIVVNRESELKRIVEIISRRKKNNCLILGEPGVGKTSLIEHLAQSIKDEKIHESLFNYQVYSLDISSLLAGTKYRGEFEEKIQNMISQLDKEEKVILFIDEFHTAVGAGAHGSNSLDFVNIFKPILSKGKIKVIASTTFEDFKKTIEKDKTLTRRFSIINLEEPSKKEALEILTKISEQYEKFHNVKYKPEALFDAVELSAKYIHNRFLPDKAIDIIDEAGAIVRLKSKTKRKQLVTSNEIREIISKIARVKIDDTKNEIEILKDLEEQLGKSVFGQNQAITTIVNSIKRSKAGLQTITKPIGSFLFAGATGVGKTELAKSLAKELNIPLLRFDMSEYMEQHSIAKLIGSPPGYVGFDEGGLLTDAVRKNPSSILLLDEIEKAHVDIYNVLLQILDNASLTDSHGKISNFSNVLIIMTTNCGSDANLSIGFGNLKSNNNRDLAIKKMLRPELRNRLDSIIYFNDITPELMLNIVNKNLEILKNTLLEKKIVSEFSDKLKEYLSKKGFDPLFGARPLARLIQSEIADLLADKILFGKNIKNIRIDYNGEKIVAN